MRKALLGKCHYFHYHARPFTSQDRHYHLLKASRYHYAVGTYTANDNV